MTGEPIGMDVVGDEAAGDPAPLTLDIVCSDPLHGARRGEPGWAETLGTLEVPSGADVDAVERMLAGYSCEACAAALSAPA